MPKKQGLKNGIRKITTAVKQRITSWSFSRWTDYVTCPFKAKCKHITKLREPDNPAMANGTIVHQLAEQHTRGDLRKCPPELVKLKAGFAELRTNKAQTEKEWAFNNKWQATSWFGPDAWVRIKVDAFYISTEKVGTKRITTVKVVDHKTGREKGEHALQRSLYAIGAFLMYPDADIVIAEHWYTETGKPVSEEFKRSQLAALQHQWEQRTRAMLNDTRFAPKPGTHCRWCHFRKANGGPCQF